MTPDTGVASALVRSIDDMASWTQLVARLQPARGRRGFAATIEESRVAAALMLAQDTSLTAQVACDKCGVPSFRSRAKNMANTIVQLGMQDVALPERWTESELADAPQDQTHGKAKHTPVKEQAGSARGGPQKQARTLSHADPDSAHASTQTLEQRLAFEDLVRRVRADLDAPLLADSYWSVAAAEASSGESWMLAPAAVAAALLAIKGDEKQACILYGLPESAWADRPEYGGSLMSGFALGVRDTSGAWLDNEPGIPPPSELILPVSTDGPRDAEDISKRLVKRSLEYESPGGHMHKHEYSTLGTPADESVDERAGRKHSNRNRELRARKAFEKMQLASSTEPEEPSRGAAAAASTPQSAQRPRRRVVLPGSTPRLRKLHLVEQVSLLMEAEAEDCDVDDLVGDVCHDPKEEELMQREAEKLLTRRATAADIELRVKSAKHETRGHGNERLSELESLLAHDAWEQVDDRASLWREHRLLLESDYRLRSCLSVPADIEESAAFWEPVPCALCGSKLRDGRWSYGCGEWWCERCEMSKALQQERIERRDAARQRRQEYDRRMREKARCYKADPTHERKLGAPPPASNMGMQNPSMPFEEMIGYMGYKREKDGRWVDIHTGRRWDRCPFDAANFFPPGFSPPCMGSVVGNLAYSQWPRKMDW